MSCRIIGVRINCIARSSLPPGITIEFARDIAKTQLPERELRLHTLLVAHGYVDPSVAPPKTKGKKKRK